MSKVMYNEVDEFCVKWLENLIADGHIAPGRVDARSIKDLTYDDVKDLTQFHTFAGIGVWSYALRLAGFPDDVHVWSGSPPCQPWSGAGKKGKTKDERHLWPEYLRLIDLARPTLLFGEQVSSSDVIGGVEKSEDVQDVRDREAVFGVLLELERESPTGLQGLLRESSAPLEAKQSEEDGRDSETLAGQEPRSVTGERGEAQSEGAGNSLQHRSGGHSSTDRRGVLRDDGDSIRPLNAEGLERAIAGSDLSGGGVHEGERSSSAVRTERDGEYVGPQPDSGDCVGDPESEAERQRGLAGVFDSAAEEESRRAWLDAVSADLEAIGYTVWAAVLPACSIGAPHKRSRLFFGAVDTRADDNSERLERLRLLVREWGSRKDLLEIGWGREALDRADANGFAGGEGSPEFGGSDSGSDALAWSGSGGDLLVGSGPDTAGLGLDGRWAGEAGDGRDEARFESDRLREVGDGADASGESYTESLSGSDGAAHQALRRPGNGSAVARDGVPVDGGDASCSGTRWNAGTDVGAQAQGLGERIAVGSVSDRALFAGAIVDGHHTFGTGPQGLTGDVRVWRGPGWLDPITARSVAQAGATRGFWGDCDWYYCRDGKYRPIGPGLFPLAHGASQRVGRLRAYGNAISPQAALVFIRSFIEALTP